LILLHWRIFSWLNQKVFYKRTLLSLHKFSKLMVHLTVPFNEIIVRSKNKIEIFLECVLELSESYLLKEKKKNKLCFSDITKQQPYVYC
jgi:hypothetical protein